MESPEIARGEAVRRGEKERNGEEDLVRPNKMRHPTELSVGISSEIINSIFAKYLAAWFTRLNENIPRNQVSSEFPRNLPRKF